MHLISLESYKLPEYDLKYTWENPISSLYTWKTWGPKKWSGQIQRAPRSKVIDCILIWI